MEKCKISLDKTKLFCVVVTLVMILQNGPLNNLPIILLLFPVFFVKDSIKLRLGIGEKFLLIYALYLFIVTLFHIKSNYNTTYTFNMFFQYLIIYFSIKIQFDTLSKKYVLKYFRNVGIVISFLSIVEAMSGIHIWANILGKTLQSNTSRVVAIFNHPIVCGCYLVITLILLLVFPVAKKRLQFVFILVVVSAIVLTQSRSAWIATLFVFVTLFIKYKKRSFSKEYTIYILSFIFSVIFISVIVDYNILGRIYDFINNRINGSLDAGEGHIIRIEVILNSITYWKSNFIEFLLGYGKNFGLLFMKEHPIIKFGGVFRWDSAIDNQYITIIHETGFIGLLIIVWIYIININRIIKLPKTNKIQLASSMCIVANAICLFFFEGFNYPTLVIFYVLFILMSDLVVASE